MTWSLRRTDIEPGVLRLAVSLPARDPLDVEVRRVSLPTVVMSIGRRSVRMWLEPETRTVFWASSNPEPTAEEWLRIGARIAGMDFE